MKKLAKGDRISVTTANGTRKATVRSADGNGVVFRYDGETKKHRTNLPGKPNRTEAKQARRQKRG